MEAVQSFLSEWLSAFLNPQKRVFWGYLFCAFLIALAWLWIARGQRLVNSLKQIFAAEAWISRSARADYLVMLINAAFMALLSPRLLAKATVAYALFNGLHQIFDGRPQLGLEPPGWIISVGFTLFLFVVDDFARYWLHRWLHTVSWLWPFHKVHHSATALNPFTVFRTHPVEAILFSIRAVIVQGFCVAVFFFFFGNNFELVTLLGASIFSFLFNALGSNLRHSPVSIGYWKPVEAILISPAQHHIHHSRAPEHIDRNFGVILSVWDRLFGTLVYSQPTQKLEYGLSATTTRDNHRLQALYIQPFKELWESATSNLRQVMFVNRNNTHSHLK